MSNHAITKTLTVDGWDFTVGVDDEPTVRDVDLATRLGFERPRDIRKLVERMLAGGLLSNTEVRATVAQTSNRGGRPGTVFHLTEVGTMLVIAKSETTMALAITREMIGVFIAARRGLLAPAAAVAPALPLDIAQGTRVGEMTCERADLIAWIECARAAQCSTTKRIHGMLRREYRVSSVYHLSLLVWPFAKQLLQALALKRLALPGKAPKLRLLNGGKQAVLPFPTA